ARALAALGQPPAWQALLGQLGSGPPELRAVLRGLCAGAPTGTGDVLLASLAAAGDTARRADAVSVLAALPEKPAGFGARMIELGLSEREPFEVRARALMALGGRPDKEALEALMQ